MRKLVGLAALAAIAAAVPAAAQPKPQGSWIEKAERLTLSRGKISLPRTVAGLSYKENKDFSHPGEGLDTSVRYESADGAVFATVYLYYPSLSHSGLALIATEEAIRSNSPVEVRFGPTRRVAAGRVAGAGLRSDMANYQGRYASSAAMVKAGRWMVKYRVSGPEARKAEVEAAMTALIDATRFEGAAQPAASAPIETSACPGSRGKDARLIVPAGGTEASAEALADALVATFDPAGAAAGRSNEDQSYPSRIGNGWCKAYAAVGKARVPLLRATGEGAAIAGAGRSRLFALYSDAGGAVEIVESGKRFMLLHHEIGKTTVLGAFDGVPTDAQMAELLGGKHEALRARARVNHSPEGGSKIELELADGAPAPTT